MEESRTTNALKWRETKVIHKDGMKLRVTATVKLADECKNGHCDFSITFDIERWARNNRWCDHGGGACGDEYCKYFDGLQRFNDLHLANYLGQPMFAVENTMYFISQEKKETTMKCTRITESEYDALQFACKTKDKVYFKFQLFQLGIVKRWKSEADEFIQFLEDKTGMKWVDPYNGEGRVYVKPLTEDELKHIEEGEWTEKAILKAEKKRKELMKKAALLKLKEDHELKIWHENKEYEVKKYLLEKGYEDCNMIYYPHKKAVEFNWVSWKPSFTIDDYNALMSDNRKPKDVDYVWKEPKSK